MPTEIDLKGVLHMREDGAQLLDVLSRSEYATSHIPGAVNVPLPELDEASAASLDRARAVIAYCFDYE